MKTRMRRERKPTADTFVIRRIMCFIRLFDDKCFAFSFRCNSIIRSLDCYIKRELRENSFLNGYNILFYPNVNLAFCFFRFSDLKNFFSMNVVRAAGGNGEKTKFKFDHGKRSLAITTSLFVRAFLKITVISS